MISSYVLGQAVTLTRVGDQLDLEIEGHWHRYYATRVPITFTSCTWDRANDLMHAVDSTGAQHFMARGRLGPAVGFAIRIPVTP